MKWKVLRKVYHNGTFVHPGQVVEADERFDGRPNMEPVKDEPKAVEPEPEHKSEPPAEQVEEVSKGAE